MVEEDVRVTVVQLAHDVGISLEKCPYHPPGETAVLHLLDAPYAHRGAEEGTRGLVLPDATASMLANPMVSRGLSLMTRPGYTVSSQTVTAS